MKIEKMSSSGNGNRRGSSIFAASAAKEGDASGPYGRPAYLYGRNDEQLLVDFPERARSAGDMPYGYEHTDAQYDAQGGQYHHGGAGSSVPYNNGNGNGGGGHPHAGYQQQYGMMQSAHASAGAASSRQGGHASAKPRRSEAARMEELANSQDLPGGPNHRPLVGGFAAAAYEAAKAHHYSKKSTEDTYGGMQKPRDSPPPSI